MKIVLRTRELRQIEETVFTPPIWLESLLDGRKIEAIKQFRSLFGERIVYREGEANTEKYMGLKEAKDFIEGIENHIKTSIKYV